MVCPPLCRFRRWRELSERPSIYCTLGRRGPNVRSVCCMLRKTGHGKRQYAENVSATNDRTEDRARVGGRGNAIWREQGHAGGTFISRTTAAAIKYYNERALQKAMVLFRDEVLRSSFRNEKQAGPDGVTVKGNSVVVEDEGLHISFQKSADYKLHS